MPLELSVSDISCGIRELIGVREQEPKDTILDAFSADDLSCVGINTNSLVDLPFGMVIFSDRWDRNKTSKYKHSGAGLAAFITANKLGKVIASDILTNPNTGNKIRMWIWQLNRPALVKWIKENRTVRSESSEEVW